MRQAYDYWQDQPGISRRVQTRSRPSLSTTDVPSKEASAAEMFLNSHGHQGRPDKQRPSRPSKDRRSDERVWPSHGQRSLSRNKTEGSEALGFLLLAPRGTKTGLSPSRTEGRRESAVRSERTAGETKRLAAKQFAVRRFPGHCAQCSATLSILTLM